MPEKWFKQRPESGLDCLICAELTRQRFICVLTRSVEWRQVKQWIVIDQMDTILAATLSLEGDPAKMVVDRVLLAPLPGDQSGVQRYTLQPSGQEFPGFGMELLAR